MCLYVVAVTAVDGQGNRGGGRLMKVYVANVFVCEREREN